MTEFCAVFLTWISKWFKSGKTNSNRRLGFWLSILVSFVWIGFFCSNKMYWLSLNSLTTICLAFRGVRNNRDNYTDKELNDLIYQSIVPRELRPETAEEIEAMLDNIKCKVLSEETVERMLRKIKNDKP